MKEVVFWSVALQGTLTPSLSSILSLLLARYEWNSLPSAIPFHHDALHYTFLNSHSVKINYLTENVLNPQMAMF